MITKTKVLCTHDWMLEIGLTDKQEKLFALIYGYSQDGVSRMRGTSASISVWLRCSERHAKRMIRELEDMGLISHEVVYDRIRRCNVTEFWAVDPAEAIAPEKGSKEKIDWIGRTPKSQTMRDAYVPNDGDINVPNHIGTTRYSRISNNKNRGGGKNTTRSRAKGTTTTTGFLFENNGSGLAAGESLKLPYTEIYFREAWERLLRQPAWTAKTPGALELELQTLADVADAIIAAYCCDLAVKKGWDTIKDPGKVYADDIEQVEAYGEICHAKERRAGQ